MTIYAHRFLATTALASLLAAPALADAPPAPAGAPRIQVAQGSGGLEEIVVTARRREENIQSVPIAITAFTQAELDNRRAVALRDVAASTPSLNLSQNTSDAFTPYSANLILRGLPGAVTYFSQVPTASAGQTGGAGSTATPGQYMDLAMLEIDKGPQGTLFGTNAIGGAILLEPKRPTENFGGYGQVTVGNYSDREFDAMLNVPVVPGKLLTRVVGKVVKRDGYTRVLGSETRLDDRDFQAWRVGVTFRPTDSIDNYLVYDGYRQDQNGSSIILSALNPNGFAARFFPDIIPLFAQQEALGPRTQVGRNVPFGSKARVWGVTDVFTWEVTDDITLKNIAAIRIRKANSPVDMDGTGLPILEPGPATAAQFATGWFTNERQYTDELQFQGRAFGDRLTWTAGGFILFADPAGPTFTPSTSLGSTTFNQPRNSSRSKALYAQGVYDLGQFVDGLKFTGGIRYNWDFVSNQTRSVTASGACASSVFADASCVGATNAKFKAPGWTLGLDYQVTPETLVYIRSGHAYLAGFANLASPSVDFARVNPQKVTDVELGIKSDWSLGGVRGRLNADIFRSWFQDIAVTKLVTFVNAGGQTVTNNAFVNAASASVKGAEIEATVIPVDGLELRAHGSYIDTKYDDYPVATFGQAAPAILYVPKWQWGANGSYTLPLDPALGTVTFTASYTWTGKEFHSPDINPFNTVPSWGKLDLRLAWDSVMDTTVDVAVFMTNATNKTYAQGAYGLYSQLGFGSYGFAEPRMYGVQLKYRFGDE